MNLARVAGGPTPSDPPNPPPAHHLPARKVIAFGLGHVLNDLCASCWFSYLLVLMHHVLGLASWQSATILLSGQIADAVATPLVGIYSDKAKGWQCGAFYIGRRHLWYIFGTALVIVNFFMLFARQSTGSQGNQVASGGVVTHVSTRLLDFVSFCSHCP